MDKIIEHTWNTGIKFKSKLGIEEIDKVYFILILLRQLLEDPAVELANKIRIKIDSALDKTNDFTGTLKLTKQEKKYLVQLIDYKYLSGQLSEKEKIKLNQYLN